MGFLRLGTVSLDGSKVKANASKHKALSYGHAGKLEAQLEQEVKELLAMAEATDREEEEARLDLPAELERRQERLAAIRQAKARIEARARERHEAEQAQYEAKVEARRAKEQATGKKARGKEPKPPEAGAREQDQVNLTDEESRIMPTSGGAFEQAYNVQAAVDVETHLIVAQFATQATNDKGQVEPALERLGALPEELGQVETMLTDNGFFSEANVEATRKAGIEPMMALGREAHHLPLGERMTVPEPPAEGVSALEEMTYRMKTPEGRVLYGRRKSTVEPVFGQIKRVLGFRQFMLRGFARICGEWSLVTTAYNIRRLFQLRNGGRNAAARAVNQVPGGVQGASMTNTLRHRMNRWGTFLESLPHRLFPLSSLVA
jgi:hypothetical protein